MSDYLNHVQDLLKGWGKWARRGGLNLGYQPTFLSLSRARRQLNPNLEMIMDLNDDDALAVDACVSEMILQHPRQHEVAIHTYRYNVAAMVSAKALSCSKSTILNDRRFIIEYVGELLPKIKEKTKN